MTPFAFAQSPIGFGCHILKLGENLPLFLFQRLKSELEAVSMRCEVEKKHIEQTGVQDTEVEAQGGYCSQDTG